MKTKSLNHVKQYFLLVGYLFIVTAGSFHFHSYNISSDGMTFISIQNSNKVVSDFLDNSETCSLDHFFQSIVFSNLASLGIITELPLVEVKTVTIVSCYLNKFYTLSCPLRAPPTI